MLLSLYRAVERFGFARAFRIIRAVLFAGGGLVCLVIAAFLSSLVLGFAALGVALLLADWVLDDKTT